MIDPGARRAAQAASLEDAASGRPFTRRLSRRAVLAGLGGMALWGALHPSVALAQRASQALAPSTRGKTLYTYKAMAGGIYTVKWSPDGKRLVTAGETVQFDPFAQVWDALTGAHPVNFAVEGNFVYSGAWSPDGQRIASGCSDAARIWDATTGETLVAYTGHSSGFVQHVSWSPDGQRAASSSFLFKETTPTVQVWDTTTGAHRLTYSGHTNILGKNALVWSPDGRFIASGSYDTTVQVWDSQSGQRLFTYTGHTESVFAVAWSPDGTRLASGAGDGQVHIWNPLTGQRYLTRHGHVAAVTSVAWSPDGKLIASGSGDRSVQLWDAATGRTLFYYYSDGNYGVIGDVAWSPDGKLIASCTSNDFSPTLSVAKVWAAV